jgi:hypothetical protein
LTIDIGEAAGEYFGESTNVGLIEDIFVPSWNRVQLYALAGQSGPKVGGRAGVAGRAARVKERDLSSRPARHVILSSKPIDVDGPAQKARNGSPASAKKTISGF